VEELVGTLGGLYGVCGMSCSDMWTGGRGRVTGRDWV